MTLRQSTVLLQGSKSCIYSKYNLTCFVSSFQPTKMADFTQVQSVQSLGTDNDKKGLLQLKINGGNEVRHFNSNWSYCGGYS